MATVYGSHLFFAHLSKILKASLKMATSDSDSELAGTYDLDLEKTTGFDASPNPGTEEYGLSRRPTRVLDPRSVLSQVTSSATQRRTFTHPLAPQPTGANVLVDFEGPNDPYRPQNWPGRKKHLTVLLYGLTTMCSSWNSSM